MPLSQDTFTLWAKREETPSGFVRHPLICHLIDVAEVTRAMWSEVVPPAARESIAAAMGIDQTNAELWLTLWAGLHDIGKASPTFQQQLPYAKVPHGTISALAIPVILTSEPFNLSSVLAHQVSIVIGGHHGVFPRSVEINQARQQKDAIGRARWANARSELAQALTSVLGFPSQRPSGALDNASAMWIAGLMSVSDWIGSDEHYFPYEDAISVASSVLGRVDVYQSAEERA